jgi:hypothetical protein
MKKAVPAPASAVVDETPVLDPMRVMRVRATRMGFDGQRRRPGDVFDIRAKDLRSTWMVEVDRTTEMRKQTPLEARRQHVDLMEGRSVKLQPNAADPIVDDDDEPTGNADVLG